MSRLITWIALCAATLAANAGHAHAHATLETQQAPAGSYYKAVLRTPHGCDGSPTIAVKIRIPDGVTSVKPQPKPGWEVEILSEELDEPRGRRPGQHDLDPNLGSPLDRRPPGRRAL